MPGFVSIRSVAAAVLTLCTLAVTSRADELFSRSRLADALDMETPGSTAPSDRGGDGLPGGGGLPKFGIGGGSPVSPSDLPGLLKAAGLPLQKTSEGIPGTTISRKGWTFPTTLQVDEATDLLRISLRLKQFAKPEQVTAVRLARLLTANRRIVGPQFFSFDPSALRFELTVVISSEGLTPALLKQVLDRAADVAIGTESIWAKDGNETAGQEQAGAGSLEGLWIAVLESGDGFALKFVGEGRFALAHRKPDGTINQSVGRYRLEDGVLHLKADDGDELSGRLARNGDQFTFTIESGAVLKFEKQEEEA